MILLRILAALALAAFTLLALNGAAENPNPGERVYCALMACVFAGLAGLVVFA